MEKHGSIGEYKAEIKEWPAYAKRLQHYFTANQWRPKESFFTQCLWSRNLHGLIRSLVQTKKPTEFSYTQLMEKV